MTARLRAGVAATTLAAAVLLACGDPNAPVATFPTYADTLELYALNGSPRNAPTAVRIIAGAFTGTSGVPTDASLSFDVALDIDEQGRPVVYPVRTVAAPFLGRHPVGLQRTTSAFDDITQAPTSGYRRDTLAVVSIGEVMLIESTDPEACNAFLGGAVYGKMIVDSVKLATRRLFVRVTADPNCNFRSLVPGVPTE